ncbi:hypothetical protein GCM10025771_14820 [Niveibacterium umoris]|uniref:YbjN domain-containing protein n=1 Tax=Niveibacterium umoris TaxID=1193620 RepID=A0A840BPT9_9RHOO|nr:YbjN domain-containing protein [Niveibacterium umoris]MBB4014643.1 hypothetical protein [Niveibacterium umoris]
MIKFLSRFKNQLTSAAESDPPTVLAPSLQMPGSPWAADGDFLLEEQVTVSGLMALFRRVLLAFELDDDSLVVETESGRVRVMVDEARKLIALRTIFRFRERSDPAARLVLANRLNAGLILVRFSVVDEDVLYADYNLIFERGLPAYQLVTTIRRFINVARGGVTEFDTEDVIG